jgi:hypothetical protein
MQVAVSGHQVVMHNPKVVFAKAREFHRLVKRAFFGDAARFASEAEFWAAVRVSDAPILPLTDCPCELSELRLWDALRNALDAPRDLLWPVIRRRALEWEQSARVCERGTVASE